MPTTLTPSLIKEISDLLYLNTGCTIHPTENYPAHLCGIYIQYQHPRFKAPTVNHYGPPMAKCLDLLARISVERNVIINVLFHLRPLRKVEKLGGWKVLTENNLRVANALWLTHDPSDLMQSPVCQDIDEAHATNVFPSVSDKSSVLLVISRDRQRTVVNMRYLANHDIRKYAKPMYLALTMLSEYAELNRVSIPVRIEHRLLRYMPKLDDRWSVLPSARQDHVIIVYSPKGKTPVVEDAAPDSKSEEFNSARTDYVYALADQMRITGLSLLSIINDPEMHPFLINTMVDGGVESSVAASIVSAGLNQLLI